MMRKHIAQRMKIMHTPKPRTCAYSGDKIERAEIAITIKPSKESNNNEWIKLTSIKSLIEKLKTIQSEEITEDSEIGTNDRLTYLRGTLSSGVATPRGKCAICDSYNIKGMDREQTCEENPHILSFTFRSDNDPWIHAHCVDDFIESLEQVFNLSDTEQSEIMSQVV